MKKTILLLAFLFVGMISFANTVQFNNSLKNSPTAFTVMLNSAVNNSVVTTRTDLNQTDYATVIENVNISYLANSCTVKGKVTVGIGGSGVTISVSATAPTCREALAMIRDMV